MAVTAARFRRIALGLEGVEERAHMGHPDFRVKGRIFATLTADERKGMVKLRPNQQETYVMERGRAFTPASGAWGRQGCTMVDLSIADEETVGEAMTLAYQNATAAVVSPRHVSSPRSLAASPARPRRPPPRRK